MEPSTSDSSKTRSNVFGAQRGDGSIQICRARVPTLELFDHWRPIWCSGTRANEVKFGICCAILSSVLRSSAGSLLVSLLMKFVYLMNAASASIASAEPLPRIDSLLLHAQHNKGWTSHSSLEYDNQSPLYIVKVRVGNLVPRLWTKLRRLESEWLVSNTDTFFMTMADVAAAKPRHVKRKW